MNKNIIIAILVVIIIAAGAVLAFGQFGKTDTKINILSENTLQNGEQVQFELKDSQGNAIAGQNVSITYNGNEKYSIITDSDGKGYLLISGEDGGKYDILIEYKGNDKYNGCTADETITITEDIPDNVESLSRGDAITTTDKYNNRNDTNPNNTDPNNTDPQIADTYFIGGQLNLLVRGSDNVVISSGNGLGIGLTVDEWMAKYGFDSPDYH